VTWEADGPGCFGAGPVTELPVREAVMRIERALKLKSLGAGSITDPVSVS
jgi:hypothetical protein